MRGASQARLLGDRDEAVSAVLAFDRSNAWIGQVKADQSAAVICQPIKQLAPRRYGLVRHVIGRRLPAGMLE
jgi:hypothetical protein